jgi:hypothetical protein
LVHFGKRRSSASNPMGLRNCGVIIEPTGFGKGKSILASLIGPTALEGVIWAARRVDLPGTERLLTRTP